MENLSVIEMCLNSDCWSCNSCYRFRAKPIEFQQKYRKYAPKEGEDMCDKFMPLYRADKGDV